MVTSAEALERPEESVTATVTVVPEAMLTVQVREVDEVVSKVLRVCETSPPSVIRGK